MGRTAGAVPGTQARVDEVPVIVQEVTGQPRPADACFVDEGSADRRDLVFPRRRVGAAHSASALAPREDLTCHSPQVGTRRGLVVLGSHYLAHRMRKGLGNSFKEMQISSSN